MAGNKRLVMGSKPHDSKLGAVVYHGLHFAEGRAASFIRHNYICVLITPSSLHSPCYLLLGAETRHKTQNKPAVIFALFVASDGVYRCLCPTCFLWRRRNGQYREFLKGDPRTTDCQLALKFFAAQNGIHSTKSINSSNCRVYHIIRILKIITIYNYH